jgi:hypothetical protein
MELDTESPIFNFHFDFDYDMEPSLYLHKDECEGCIITKNGYVLICESCSEEVSN